MWQADGVCSTSTGLVVSSLQQSSKYLTGVLCPVHIFSSSDGLVVNVGIMLVAVAICYLLSVATKTLSHVDRFWSLASALYTFVFAKADMAALVTGNITAIRSPRNIVMSASVLLWSVRLTHNFIRRGGYDSLSAEDYRWHYVRQSPLLHNRFVYEVFNLTFVAFAQNVLLLLITLPAYISASLGPGRPLDAIDCLSAGLFIMFLSGEAIADQQQYTFQEEKHRRIQAGEALTGLYKQADPDTGFGSTVGTQTSSANKPFGGRSIYSAFQQVGVAGSMCA